MQTDELRAELAELASEVTPFAARRRRRPPPRRPAPDRQRIGRGRRRARARRVGVVALTRSGPEPRTRRRLGEGGRDRAASALRRRGRAAGRRDRPPMPHGSQRLLDSTDAVVRYASSRPGVSRSQLVRGRTSSSQALQRGVCAEPSIPELRGRARPHGSRRAAQLTRQSGTDATVQSIGTRTAPTWRCS